MATIRLNRQDKTIKVVNRNSNVRLSRPTTPINLKHTGKIGPQGATGATGSDGIGIPVGGTTGQVLAKTTATDYDTEWVEQTGGGMSVTGTSGTLTGTADTDGGDFNLYTDATGTLAIYGSAGNTLDVDLLDGNLTVAGTISGSNLSGTNTGDQDISGKQDVLVSGTNIKTVNSSSILGSGNLSIESPDTLNVAIAKQIGSLYGRPAGSTATLTSINSSVCAWLVWTAPWACSIDRIYFGVTTAGAGGATARVSYYAVDTNNLPTGTAVASGTTTPAIDSTGIKYVDLASAKVMTKGEKIAFCLQASANTTFRSFSSVQMGGTSTTNLTGNSSIRQVTAYASGTPTAAGAVDTSNNNIMILPRVSA